MAAKKHPGGETMSPAPMNNEFWKLREVDGMCPFFESPSDMWKWAIKYFQWVEENPLKAEKIFSNSGEIVRGEYNKMRAMTIEGLCNFIGITSRCWRKYKNKEDFIPVMEMVEQIIRTQKFEGAAAELLNANIIARDLGLADKKEHTGKDGGPIETMVSMPPAFKTIDEWVAWKQKSVNHQNGDT